MKYIIFRFTGSGKGPVLLSLFLLVFTQAFSQLDTLLQMDESVSFIRAFDGTRVINGQSPETVYKKELQLMISHRFGTVSSGIHSLYGLDQSNVRIGLDYGISNRLMAGIGRSSQKETYDGYVKFRLLRQSTGAHTMPLSLTMFAGAAVMTNRKSVLDTVSGFSSRLAYVYQIIAARRTGRLTIQLSPTLVYRNQIESYSDQFYVFSMGIAGRYRLSKRVSFTGEYFYVLPGYVSDNYYNSFSIGVDIQTGGHVFQLHLSNSQGMIEQFYILKTGDNWFKNGMRLGFNITRVFNLKKSRKRSW